MKSVGLAVGKQSTEGGRELMWQLRRVFHGHGEAPLQATTGLGCNGKQVSALTEQKQAGLAPWGPPGPIRAMVGGNSMWFRFHWSSLRHDPKLESRTS